jgi:DNA-binding transcriptional ArsR family regulator
MLGTGGWLGRLHRPPTRTEHTRGHIARAAGGIAHSTLSRATELLTGKGIVAAELPISRTPSKERRYRITDPYLRFWLAFLGSIKWLENSPFDNHDLTELQRHRHRVTDDLVPLIAVTRSGTTTEYLDAVFTPADLLEAWQPRNDQPG